MARSRRGNPGDLPGFERAFRGLVAGRRRSGDWIVWDVIGDPAEVAATVAEVKRLGYGSAWTRHGQLGVLALQVDA